jgi:hypothetical protein
VIGRDGWKDLCFAVGIGLIRKEIICWLGLMFLKKTRSVILACARKANQVERQPDTNGCIGLLFAAATTAAFNSDRALLVVDELIIPDPLLKDRWFLSRALWFGDWLSWLRTSATLKNKKIYQTAVN